MRKLATLPILIALAIPTLVAETNNVVFVGGTIAPDKEGRSGRFDFTSGSELRFVSSAGSLEIPYQGIESFEHTKQLAVHGVVPIIAVALVASLNHNDFVRITYKDSDQLSQVAVFQVPKTMPAFLMSLLEARAPRAYCKPYEDCTPKPIPPRTVASQPATSAPQPAQSK